MFFFHSILVLKAAKRLEMELEGQTWPGLDWCRTSKDSLKREGVRDKRECKGVYLSRWRRAFLPPSLPSPLHVFWGRELWLKHIAAPHSGWAPSKWGEWGLRRRVGERRIEAGAESSLKRVVKIMKTNGDRVSWDGEENFICEASFPRFCLHHGKSSV